MNKENNFPQNQNKSLLPPSSVSLEEGVIGAMLVDEKCVEDCLAILKTPDIFYKPANKAIFSAIQSLFNLGAPVDLLSVVQQLRTDKTLDVAGGELYLIGLTQKISSGAHIEHHSYILLQYFIKRQVIFMNQAIIALAYNDDTDALDLLAKWQKFFDELNDVINVGRSIRNFSQALDALQERIEIISKSTEEVPMQGVDTGFKRTNRFTGGWRKQNLIICAARPGMGKTSFVLKTVIENVKKQIPVGVISLEMSADELTARMVAIDTNFHLGQLLKKGFEKLGYFETYQHHKSRMSKYPVYIDDSAITDLSDVVMKAKQMKRKYGIELLVIDYLQLMTDRTVKSGNRENEINNISRRLKRLAKELDIPVIALSQLSRAVETRGSSKRPLLSDLRESGAIEQDADVVLFIYRPEYYKIEMDEEDYDDKTKELVRLGANAEIIFAKYRGGSLGTALLKWIGDKTKFMDVEDYDESKEYIVDHAEMKLPNVEPDVAF